MKDLREELGVATEEVQACGPPQAASLLLLSLVVSRQPRDAWPRRRRRARRG